MKQTGREQRPCLQQPKLGTSEPANAGNDGGRGGQGVVCPHSSCVFVVVRGSRGGLSESDAL